MENIYAELVALDAQEKPADAETTRLLVENNDKSTRNKEMVGKAVNGEKRRQERMQEGYKESTNLSLWLFNTTKTCSVPQLKIEATTATEVYDTYIKAQNKTSKTNGTGHKTMNWLMKMEEVDVGPQNYDDPMIFKNQQDQQLALVLAEEFTRRNEQEHVELNGREGSNGQQNLELNQENADDQIGLLPRNDNHRIPQLHPVAQVPAATSATAVNQSEPARTISVLVPAAAPTVSQAVGPQVNPAPVPVEVPAPAKNRVPTIPKPTYPTPTVSIFLKNLHACFQSLRTPVLNGVIETIKKEMKKHQNNTNPVSINYVVASISTIVDFASQGDPVDENEETISKRIFVTILAQSFVLLNSSKFETVLETLKDQSLCYYLYAIVNHHVTVLAKQ
ncbi:hypothetical protein CAEBREN_05198 [Caenorhabditis brenneri]|uniref:Uncharacterized protein n=1 Tax=Caenorhabditis brenneri TaxID=135651 RepID=G0NX13_CAEBE|nr:hypothetical protein CAEBREN_05198 [Caenorhabditis brenneri]